MCIFFLNYYEDVFFTHTFLTHHGILKRVVSEACTVFTYSYKPKKKKLPRYMALSKHKIPLFCDNQGPLK